MPRYQHLYEPVDTDGDAIDAGKDLAGRILEVREDVRDRRRIRLLNPSNFAVKVIEP